MIRPSETYRPLPTPTPLMCHQGFRGSNQTCGCGQHAPRFTKVPYLIISLSSECSTCVQLLSSK
jgi:hypothetical protein